MKLTIWPQHCIISTTGHAVTPEIDKALQKWAKHKRTSVEYVRKGENLRTEMYSALSADVEDPEDITTAFNDKLMSKLRISDQVIICGQARSHVVKFTLLDILNNWTGDTSRLCLLEDGCSSARGFEKQGQDFLDDMVIKGVKVLKCNEVFSKKNFIDVEDNFNSYKTQNQLSEIKTMLTAISEQSSSIEQIAKTLQYMQERISMLEGLQKN